MEIWWCFLVFSGIAFSNTEEEGESVDLFPAIEYYGLYGETVADPFSSKTLLHLCICWMRVLRCNKRCQISKTDLDLFEHSCVYSHLFVRMRKP